MTVRPGSEFSFAETLSEVWRRHHLYLAEQDNGSVLAAGARPPVASDHRSGKDSDRSAVAFETQAMIQAARLADPAYQAMSARIIEELDQMDIRSVMALQDIEYALLELRREREELLERAYRDENGRRIAMTEDGTAAHYVDDEGGRVDDETLLRIRDDLRGRDPYEQFQRNAEREQEFYAHRDKIHAGMTAGDQLRDDLAAGAISAEDAEQRARGIEASQGAVLDAAEAAVSEAEDAIFGARENMPAPDDSTPDADLAATVPATAPAPR